VKVLVANVRGFCAGVERAVAAVQQALELFGAPVYVRHEIVHNRRVVEGLRAQGAEFVEDLAEVPDGALVLFSAHGVAQDVYAEARRRQLTVIDATCPLVTKVHLEVARHARAGRTVLLIGHRNHPEVIGTRGHYHGQGKGEIRIIESHEDALRLDIPPDSPVAYVTQTTLSLDDTARIVNTLRSRYPQIIGPYKDDICYATQNRQNAVRELALRCDAIVVVGDDHSSNSNRLKELAQACDRPAYLVNSAKQLEYRWFESYAVIGLTSGAAVPEILFSEILALFEQWWPRLSVETIGQPEQIQFRLPRFPGQSPSTPISAP
jgi:4-hydroxy-3-methylbut-2-en-1-yl diphosphate reductase